MCANTRPLLRYTGCVCPAANLVTVDGYLLLPIAALTAITACYCLRSILLPPAPVPDCHCLSLPVITVTVCSVTASDHNSDCLPLPTTAAFCNANQPLDSQLKCITTIWCKQKLSQSGRSPFCNCGLRGLNDFMVGQVMPCPEA